MKTIIILFFTIIFIIINSTIASRLTPTESIDAERFKCERPDCSKKFGRKYLWPHKIHRSYYECTPEGGLTVGNCTDDLLFSFRTQACVPRNKFIKSLDNCSY